MLTQLTQNFRVHKQKLPQSHLKICPKLASKYSGLHWFQKRITQISNPQPVSIPLTENSSPKFHLSAAWVHCHGPVVAKLGLFHWQFILFLHYLVSHLFPKNRYKFGSSSFFVSWEWPMFETKQYKDHIYLVLFASPPCSLDQGCPFFHIPGYNYGSGVHLA